MIKAPEMLLREAPEMLLKEVPETLLREVAPGLLFDIDEDSMALASAIETFAFGLAKLVVQTLIWVSPCVQTSYFGLQHHSTRPKFSCSEVRRGNRTTYGYLGLSMKSDRDLELPESHQCSCYQNPSRN